MSINFLLLAVSVTFTWFVSIWLSYHLYITYFNNRLGLFILKLFLIMITLALSIFCSLSACWGADMNPIMTYRFFLISTPFAYIIFKMNCDYDLVGYEKMYNKSSKQNEK